MVVGIASMRMCVSAQMMRKCASAEEAYMIDPTEQDIGRKVIYTGNYGGQLEEGVITSFYECAVYVCYGTNYHSKATNRSDLEWAPPKTQALGFPA
jgi:hypothetical protein